MTPGKRTLVEGLDERMFASAGPHADDTHIQSLAATGVSGAAAALPHRDIIQRLFGRHDVGRIAAHTDDRARDASGAIGAQAYATGDHVAFATGSPSLHTAAHEAAHVVQQRGGVQLSGGVGAAGDRHEQHADHVADLVVHGRSAEAALDEVAGARSGSSPPAPPASVQRLIKIDDLGDKDSIVKLVALYNQMLDGVVARGASRIQKAEVESLAGRLRKIKGLLAAPGGKLLEDHKRTLQQRVQAELDAVTAAAAAPETLAKLVPGGATPIRRSATAVPRPARLDQHAPAQIDSDDNSAPPASTTTHPASITPQFDDPASAQINNNNAHVDNTSAPHLDHSATQVDQHAPIDPHASAQINNNARVDNASATTDDNSPPVSAPVSQPSLRTKREDATRIGFEIEPGASYVGALPLKDILAPFVNQTLVTFTSTKGNNLLEMLLDDPKVEHGKVRFQVEFRTPPLQISDISPQTAIAIRDAMLAFKPKHLFTGGSPGQGWTRDGTCTALIGALGKHSLETQSFQIMPPADLAQHVTSSINLGAYPKLPADQQHALYSHGTGSTTKVELYQKIMAALGQSKISASTTGRNDAVMTVKSPIESMVAAEQAHGLSGAENVTRAMTDAPRPTVAATGLTKKDEYSIDPLDRSVSAIHASGEYPSMQGEHDKGYLAVAEKLQPPLLDPVNNELRVLVEHRNTDDLRKAVNVVLAGGKSKVWDDFVEAVRAMDAARR